MSVAKPARQLDNAVQIKFEATTCTFTWTSVSAHVFGEVVLGACVVGACK